MREYFRLFVQVDSIHEANALAGRSFSLTATNDDEFEPNTIAFEAQVEDDTPDTNGVNVRVYDEDALQYLYEEQVQEAVAAAVADALRD